MLTGPVERSSEQRLHVLSTAYVFGTAECGNASLGDAAAFIVGAVVATYANRMVGATILWGAL